MRETLSIITILKLYTITAFTLIEKKIVIKNYLYNNL